jgi:folate-dependent phosphoribosylglycinamide formyltransferase PurN
MKKKIILLTGNEQRHLYSASYLSSQKNIDLKLVVHESNIKLKENSFYEKDSDIKKHINLRSKTENLFFKKFTKKNRRYNSISIKNKKINDEEIINLVKKQDCHYIIAFGCSIISQKFINNFKGNFLNIHLGLAPYYKGSGTNFFPFVNKELQFCGSTIMQISKKVDGGKIIHQTRPDFEQNDNIHTIGNKIIKKTFIDLCKIITKKKKFKFFKVETKYKTKIYKRKDFNKKTLKIAMSNIENKLVPEYISKYKKSMERKYPLKSQL